jgi:hypothetical protein
MEFQGAGYSATVTGSVAASGAMEFDFDGLVKNLAEFSWVRNRFDLSGNLRVNGRLEGDREKLLLDAALYGPLAGTTPGIVDGLMTAGVVKGQLWPVLMLHSATFTRGPARFPIIRKPGPSCCREEGRPAGRSCPA